MGGRLSCVSREETKDAHHTKGPRPNQYDEIDDNFTIVETTRENSSNDLEIDSHPSPIDTKCQPIVWSSGGSSSSGSGSGSGSGVSGILIPKKHAKTSYENVIVKSSAKPETRHNAIVHENNANNDKNIHKGKKALSNERSDDNDDDDDDEFDDKRSDTIVSSSSNEIKNKGSNINNSSVVGAVRKCSKNHTTQHKQKQQKANILTPPPRSNIKEIQNNNEITSYMTSSPSITSSPPTSTQFTSASQLQMTSSTTTTALSPSPLYANFANSRPNENVKDVKRENSAQSETPEDVRRDCKNSLENIIYAKVDKSHMNRTQKKMETFPYENQQKPTRANTVLPPPDLVPKQDRRLNMQGGQLNKQGGQLNYIELEFINPNSFVKKSEPQTTYSDVINEGGRLVLIN